MMMSKWLSNQLFFDNTQSIHIQPNLKQPHFIIAQEVPENDAFPEFLNFQK